MAEPLTVYESICEVWVKPWFRKARPKIERKAWSATSDLEFLRLVSDYYSRKRFTLIQWRILAAEQVSLPEGEGR